MPRPPLKLLYVEDDRLSQLLVTEALRQAPGFSLQCADTPQAALTLAQAWRPDLLLIDAMLPGLSGHELLRRLRALPGLAEVPAAMYSADDDAHSRQRALDAGFDIFWSKPMPPDAWPGLLATLARRPCHLAQHGTLVPS